MDFTLLLALVFAFSITKMLVDQRAKNRADNLRLLEQALQNPAVDRATVETLTFQLTGRRPAREAGPSRTMAILLAFGWIALFSGIGVMAIGGIVGAEEALAGGVMPAVIGFGLITYPFALRELEGRQKA